MPREQINYPSAYFEMDADTGVSKKVAPADSALHVSWDTTGTLQIGYETDRKTAAEILDARSPHFDGGEPSRAVMYTPVLSRSEVNKLIRVLRRARDQAYGKDE